ncbi:MAG: Na+ dependent nucleoside transporter N-terminal domain-containing protein, partial [Gemmatimonadales bacterium]
MTGLWILQQALTPLMAQEGLDTPLLQRGMGIVGIAVMIGIAWSMSSDRSKVSWRLVGFGVALQVAFGFLVLKTGVGHALFDGANNVFAQLLAFTEEGARFI